MRFCLCVIYKYGMTYACMEIDGKNKKIWTTQADYLIQCPQFISTFKYLYSVLIGHYSFIIGSLSFENVLK